MLEWLNKGNYVYESIICVLKFDYDYDIPFHNVNYEKLANRNGNIIAKDWFSLYVRHHESCPIFFGYRIDYMCYIHPF